MTKDFPKVNLPIVWDEKYSRIGVTPTELYMRQQGLCWLRPEVNTNGKVIIYCTDGTDKAETSKMLNPTFECVRCMMSFTTKAVEDGVSGNKPEVRKDTGSNNNK